MDTEVRTQQDPGWHVWHVDVVWVVEVTVYPWLRNFYWHVGLCSKVNKNFLISKQQEVEGEVGHFPWVASGQVILYSCLDMDVVHLLVTNSMKLRIDTHFKLMCV